jgi:hypothetical protein
MIDQRKIACPSCSAPAGHKCYGTYDEDHYGRHKLACELEQRIERTKENA